MALASSSNACSNVRRGRPGTEVLVPCSSPPGGLDVSFVDLPPVALIPAALSDALLPAPAPPRLVWDEDVALSPPKKFLIPRQLMEEDAVGVADELAVDPLA